ncbi:HET-domain-containing protein, partial [Lojkania enalia]
MINTPDDEWHLHHDTYAAVQDAASRIGCPICVELVKRIDEFTPSSSSDNRTCIKYGFIKVDPDYRIVDLKVDESDNYPSSTDFRWHLIRVSGIEYDKHLASLHHVCLNTPPSSTGDPDVAALARSWLDECQREHTTCYNGSPDYYPPRLLDLNESVPRLVTTEPLIEQRRINGPYATLSHCWGPNPQFLTLTQDNIHQLQQEIPIPNLPATFGDAISFCRQLNLQYLWIDSLCIIQSGDNSQDQSLHLPKIPAIYRNALLNISAAHVASPTEPLFSARNPQAIKPILLKNEYLLISDSFLEDEPFHSPLHRRAWVLQERLLSPRVVHFGRNQVFWECSEWNKDAMRSETFQGGLPRKLGLDKEFDLPDFQSTEKEDADEAMSVLVSEYSDCKLTYPDHDKLVAFAGIAEHFSRVCGDEYVAGLFLREFPDALVWIVLIPPKSRPEYRIYRCPSWSWGN